MKIVLIFGGSGFVGKNLIEELHNSEYEIYLVTRNPSNISSSLSSIVKVIEWDNTSNLTFLNKFQRINIVINLAGESISHHRWTKSVKEKILSSRVRITNKIVAAINEKILQPDILINASAVGYYGSCGEIEITESTEAGQDFLSRVCQAWESEANKVQNHTTRIITLRTGIVIGNAGALSKMVIPFKLFIGGPLGNGTQWFPWIHIKDLTSMIRFIIEHPELEGAINATTPGTIRMKEFCAVLGEVLNRPSWLPVPEAILKIALGEMSDMITGSQRIVPYKILTTDFEYKFPDLKSALENILHR